MRSIAIYLDEIPFVEGHPTQLRGYLRKFVDQWCAMAGLTPIWVDDTRTLRKTNKTVVWSWSELVEVFGDDHKLVFLKAEGATALADFEHPPENVIYCIGADEGEDFGGLDPEALGLETLRLPTSVRHGLTTAAIIAADCMLRGN